MEEKVVSPLIPPPLEIDLEAGGGGGGDQLQCRICLETDGRDFIAPCKCKGTSKYVHRDCLDHWRAVKVISALAYLVHFIDGYQQYWLRTAWGFDNEVSFYYICGALLFFALLGLSGCFITCYDRRVRNDLAQPCRELCLCCCQPGVLVATMVGQRIWQRHYHILAKRMLTKEYVVEDVDGERTDWCPPPLPAEHISQLKSLGLL
nr:unnamed protein product [Digitaria exilis]